MIGAEDDILVQASVTSEGAQGIDFAAGTDGTGNVVAEKPLESRSAGGDVLLTAGNSGGDILLKDSSIAQDLVRLTAPGGGHYPRVRDGDRQHGRI